MPADVPAPVQPGPEPDRERLQQAQAPPPASGGAHRGRAVGGHRPAARPVLPARVPELLPTLRIHTNRHTILKSAPDPLLWRLLGLGLVAPVAYDRRRAVPLRRGLAVPEGADPPQTVPGTQRPGTTRRVGQPDRGDVLGRR